MSFPYFTILARTGEQERARTRAQGHLPGRSVVGASLRSAASCSSPENPSRSPQKVSESSTTGSASPPSAGSTSSTTCARRHPVRRHPWLRLRPAHVPAGSWPTMYAQTLGRSSPNRPSRTRWRLCVAEVAHFGETCTLSCTSHHLRRVDHQRATLHRHGRHDRAHRDGAQRSPTLSYAGRNRQDRGRRHPARRCRHQRHPDFSPRWGRPGTSKWPSSMRIHPRHSIPALSPARRWKAPIPGLRRP